MGLTVRRNLGLPDSQIGWEPAHRFPIIQLIREARPRIVLAPYPEDRHPDHAAAGRLVRDACFLAGVREVGDGQPHRPSRIIHYMLSQPFEPSFVVDISSVWDRKLAAINAYESQFHSTDAGFKTAISEPNFMRFIEARAIWFGAMIGAAFGEAFYMPGPVPLAELPGLADPRPVEGALPPYSVY
jgi:bacillithiol biosynthesis deacetylase BshB1